MAICINALMINQHQHYDCIKICNIQAPRLIYVNFVKDDAFLKKAKTNPCLKKFIDDCNLPRLILIVLINPDGFCRLFNFDYTLPQFKQLAGIGEFNIKANADTVKAFLNKEFGNAK